ncbi:MAG TPA: flagellar biosynthetic protein FliO [Methylophilaceae bacterium]
MTARILPFLALTGLLLPGIAGAADNAAISPAGSAIQMTFGLVMVLSVILLLAWLFKRFAPGVSQGGSVARIVGGVSVGNRERVLVVEVADRWLVIGVAPGQITGIANLDAGKTDPSRQSTPAPYPFAQWLSRSLQRQRADNPATLEK